jgi:hypothetical protein
MSNANSGVGHSMSGGGYLVALFTLEVAHSKLVAVAVHWQQKRFWLAGWQTGNGRGLGHGPANERKGPV